MSGAIMGLIINARDQILAKTLAEELTQGRLYGDGSDGVLDTTGNVELPVLIEDEGFVIRQYESIKINSGHTLTTDKRCDALIIFCQGDMTVDGTVSMTGKGSNIPIPGDVKLTIPVPIRAETGYGYVQTGLELGYEINAVNMLNAFGGKGGNGGFGGGTTSNNRGPGGIAPAQGTYSGGTVGAGGGGGAAFANSGVQSTGGQGGDGEAGGIGEAGGASITTSSAGANPGNPGGVCGGGGGAANRTSGTVTSGAGGHGQNGGAGGGGGCASDTSGTPTAGSGQQGQGYAGGGVLIIFVGGNLVVNGQIVANGLNGGNGGNGDRAYSNNFTRAGGGGGGGGTGGGVVIIIHQGTYTNNGTVSVNGGSGGSGGNAAQTFDDAEAGASGASGTAGFLQVINAV